MPPVTIPPEVEQRARREHEARQRFRLEYRTPITILYVGIALLLGGCLLSLLLAMVSENSTGIGLAFICTVPTGLILLVIGAILMQSRKEGRSPRQLK